MKACSSMLLKKALNRVTEFVRMPAAVATAIFALLPLSTTLFAIEEPMIFHQLPKNGGTPIRELIEKQFVPHKICRESSFLKINSVKNLKSFKLIRGTFFYSQLKHIKAKRVTFLRDPVERVVSEHHLWVAGKSQNVKHLLYTHHFLQPGDPLKTMENHQCLFLSSYDPRNRSIPIQTHLKSAKQNLKKFFFVGICEDLEGALRALYILMGWRPASVAPRLIDNIKAEKLPLHVLDSIKKRNWADIQLYEYAKKLYTKKLNRIQKSIVIKNKSLLAQKHVDGNAR